MIKIKRVTRTFRIDPDLIPKMEKKIIKMKTTKHVSLSDYINELIKKDVLTEQEGEEYLEEAKEEIEKELEEDIQNILQEVHKPHLTFDKLETVKKDIWRATLYPDSDRRREALQHKLPTIEKALKKMDLIKNLDYIKSVMIELNELKDGIERNDWSTLRKLCDMKNKDKGLLMNIMYRRGKGDRMNELMEILY